MDRIVLTPEQQTKIDEFKDSYEFFDPDGQIYEGSNLVVDDNLQVDNSWEGVVLGGEGGLVWFYVPAWDLILPIDLVNYVTDRAGPDGQTMPIFDPVVINPQGGGCDEAVARATAPRRSFKSTLRDTMRRLSPSAEHHAAHVLHDVLDPPPKCPPKHRGRK